MPVVRLAGMVLWCSTLAWAEAPDQTDQDALLTRVMRAIGVDDQLAQTPAMMEAQLDARQEQLPPALHDKMRQVFLEASRPEAMRRSVKASLEREFDDEKFSAVLEQFSTPLFRRIVQCETAGSSPSSAAALQQFTDDLREHEPSQTRVELAQRLNTATGADDLLVQMSTVITQGFATGMAAAQGAAPPEAARVGQLVEQQAASSRGQMQDALLTRCLLTYRSVSDEDLAQYVEFSESPLGQWLIPLVNQALMRAFSEMADQAGQQLFEFARTQR